MQYVATMEMMDSCAPESAALALCFVHSGSGLIAALLRDPAQRLADLPERVEWPGEGQAEVDKAEEQVPIVEWDDEGSDVEEEEGSEEGSEEEGEGQEEEEEEGSEGDEDDEEDDEEEDDMWR